MFECVTKVDGKVQREIIKQKMLAAVIGLIIGAVWSAVFVVLSSIFFYETWPRYLALFVVVLAISFIFYLRYRNLIKFIDKYPFVNSYTFYDDEIYVQSINYSGDFEGESKIPYKNLKKVKQNDNYYMIFINKHSVWPIEKSKLTEEQNKKLEDIFKNFNLLK